MSCAKEIKNIALETSQMKSICELAVMECYYHNVAKYKEENATGILWWEKDRHFWMEYAGVVTIGVDTSLMNIEVKDENVTITIPPAKVLGCKVDETTLTEDSFIVAQNSAKVEAEHQTEAFKSAKDKLESEAKSNFTLLAAAQQRVQKLLEDYVTNIGNSVGKTYKIKWIYLEGAEELNKADVEPSASAISE
ncbi:hypothetical protein GCWU000282_03188 [Catonella morbi ATCC 51271]|uniref:DUF4230 domain-containing protein n=2 Tax=Catonella TaxID=43996 RepID=V2Y0Q4_9FIRM|nr:hypothetical protein GCWU000282_03188 [Catonella morbi ATCC 51271]